jgi:DNA-binding LytR/AlgR family response regulator
VGWRDAGRAQESLVRAPLKDLIAQLDPSQFAQVHRSVVVNLRAVSRVVRGEETAEIHLKGREEVLPVSRAYLHLFREM